MPGKVNPTQCEALTMVCGQVIGNDAAIAFAGCQGNFELNVFKPVLIFNAAPVDPAAERRLPVVPHHCAEGIEPNRERIEQLLHESLMLVTALNPHIGYDKAAKVAKKAYKENKTLRETVVELGYMTGERFDEVVQPEKMIGPED